MREGRRGLAFRVTIEFLNEIFNLLKRRKYKLVPKDVQIYAIKGEDMMFDGYTITVTSKEFPVVPQECNCSIGYIKVDKEKGIIELKERE